MRRSGARGFVLITLAVSLVLLVGVTGLVVDLGRLQIARNELQAAADAAALAAAFELDGTAAGVERAVEQGRANPNRWNFGAEAPQFEVLFAASASGPYVAEPVHPEDVRYLRVRARAAVPTYFVPAIAKYQELEAVASAGQITAPAMHDNWLPYAVDAEDPEAPDFGLQPGRLYALRLVDFGAQAGPRYLDEVRSAILSGVEGRGLARGDKLAPAPSDWDTEAQALDDRLAQDTDAAARTYSDYSGNGRRFLILPVRDEASGTVAGFAGFFLRSEACGSQAPGPCRAEYVGAALLPGRKGAGPPGVYRVSLLQ